MTDEIRALAAFALFLALGSTVSFFILWIIGRGHFYGITSAAAGLMTLGVWGVIHWPIWIALGLYALGVHVAVLAHSLDRKGWI